MKKSVLKTSLDEEYYPISQEILSSFPKYRPAVDLYVFQEEIQSLYPLAVKEQRLTNEKIDEIAKACKEGRLFVPRSDHHIYVKHLAKQVDFVLIDSNLRDSEIKQIVVEALSMRLQALMDQTLTVVYKRLYADLMVFTEYLWRDKYNIKYFMSGLHIGEDNLIAHSINVLTVGTWLYFQTEKKPVRKTLDRIVQGLLLHDLGCIKIPPFILNKKTPRTKDELEKYHSHPRFGCLLMQKFGCTLDEINQMIMQHHERLDGSGYPNSLSGVEISDFGLLAATADAFSAMITDRPAAPRVKTREAAQALFEDQRFYAKYTGILLNAYSDGTFDNV